MTDKEKQEIESRINELRGEFLEAKEEILEELQTEILEAKNYTKEYLIDCLDRFLAEKSAEWNKKQDEKKVLVEWAGMIHPKYWQFVFCGGRLVLSILSLPLFFLGVIVSWFRRKNNKS